MRDFDRDETAVYWDNYGIIRGPGGIHVHASELKTALAGLGVEVGILNPGANQGSLLGKVLGSKFVAPELCFRDLMRRHQGGKAIYHGLSNFNLPVMGHTRATRRLAAGSRVKFVLTVHDLIPLVATQGNISWALTIQMQILMPLALRVADAVVAVSRWSAESIVERYPWVKSRLHVIPNGFPPFQGVKRAQYVSGKVRVLTVGRSENYKRHGFFFSMLEQAGGRLSGTLVAPALSPPLMKRATELAEKGLLELALAPSHDELAAIYARHDVYVHPSLYEGFCLPAAEAQAYGIPVVFTSGTGISEVVCPTTGRGLSHLATPAEWVEAVLAVAGSGRLEALASWVQSRPTWNDSAIQLKTLYNSL